MKTAKKILFWTGLVLLTFALLVYGYLQTQKPNYSGQIYLDGPKKEIEVIFDNYGVPHIYADSEEDAYFGLGYVHAQDRLFQMELLRRLGPGRLSEILGPDLIQTDLFFKTLGINEVSKRSLEHFNKSKNKPWHKGAMAYLNGINQYIKTGNTPIEYSLLGIEKESFTPIDIYNIIGYMAFSFAPGFKTDPLLTQIYKDHGIEYLNDLSIEWNKGDLTIKNYSNLKNLDPIEIAMNFNKIMTPITIPTFRGSNGWAVSPNKTKNGKTILCNDTHIGFAQPSVWYEAHIECPNFSFYGNHLAGFPFGLTGHTPNYAWGITMFENDDVDFYIEKENPNNPNQIWIKGQWETLQIRNDTIKIKNESPLVFNVKTSSHGPIANSAMESVSKNHSSPVSVWWAYYHLENKTLEASYSFSHSENISEMRTAAFKVKAPGLNIMYGDNDGNIAWWAAAQLPIRPKHVNSKLFLDGSSGKDEIIGFFKTEENPQSENPPCGYVYSANNQPDTIFSISDSGKGTLYPGYYAPENRAKRINELLAKENSWDTEKMKGLLTEISTDIYPEIGKMIINELNQETITTDNQKFAVSSLESWDGSHAKESIAPVIYNKLVYKVLEDAMLDEIGDNLFNILLPSHLLKKSISKLLNSKESVWWDNILTSDKNETRKDIFNKAFISSIKELEHQLGNDPNEWKWHKVHTIEHVHPIGRKKPFDKIFNVGPYGVMSGDELINNQGFGLNSEGEYKVTYGPAMRRIIDFSNFEQSLSILPTGQSGNIMSAHYKDQAIMYNNGKFRKQMMNKEEILNNKEGILNISPK